jgi:hypothetical protein
MINQFLGVFVGFVLGILGKSLYDELKAPKLEIKRRQFSPDSAISKKDDREVSIKIYKLRVQNKPRKILSSAARNCRASFIFKETEIEKQLQLCWESNEEQVTINVEDSRDIEFCGTYIGDRGILFPSQKHCFRESPRIIPATNIRGIVRVTCENGRKCERNVEISRLDSTNLEVRIL